MKPAPGPAAQRGTATPRLQRLLGRWWRRQSPARQDRFVTVAPLISVLLFLAAIISAFWYLRNEEFDRETESVKRDVEVTQQQIGLRLIQHQEQLVRLAGEMATRPMRPEEFLPVITAFIADRPEVTQLAWHDAKRKLRVVHWSPLHHSGLPPDEQQAQVSRPGEGSSTASEGAFRTARQFGTVLVLLLKPPQLPDDIQTGQQGSWRRHQHIAFQRFLIQQRVMF